MRAGLAGKKLKSHLLACSITTAYYRAGLFPSPVRGRVDSTASSAGASRTAWTSVRKQTVADLAAVVWSQQADRRKQEPRTSLPASRSHQFSLAGPSQALLLSCFHLNIPFLINLRQPTCQACYAILCFFHRIALCAVHPLAALL